MGFSEEEGQRYKATFLGSGSLLGDFKPEWLDQKDADGVSMREAMAHAGLNIADIPLIKRNPADYLGFIEIHVEQGPVLNALDIPLGIVTSINGNVRYLCEITGLASHAGTTPMATRRDAATAAAEVALYVEKRAAQDADSVGTVGMLQVPNGSINVVPGRCLFSLDLRAPLDAQRDALANDVLAEIAGHDAMKLHKIMPQAMLLVRGQNSGISHNPLESTTSDDIQLGIEAFTHLLHQLAKEQP